MRRRQLLRQLRLHRDEEIGPSEGHGRKGVSSALAQQICGRTGPSQSRTPVRCVAGKKRVGPRWNELLFNPGSKLLSKLTGHPFVRPGEAGQLGLEMRSKRLPRPAFQRGPECLSMITCFVRPWRPTIERQV